MTDEPKDDPRSEREKAGWDPNDPGEVATSFATKGLGWSGREDEEDDDPSS